MDSDQEAKLAQLRAIIDSNNGESDINVLQSVGWDVQKAVELLFEEGHVHPSQSTQPTGRGIEQFQVEDSLQSTPPRSNPVPRANPLAILSWPFTFTLNLLSYVFRILRIPFPRVFSRPLGVVFNWNAFTSLWKPAKREDPGVVAERWVQALEDEVGALTWARLRAAEVAPDSVKEMPDFYLGSYGDVLNTAKRELKILCVVLVSDEHDDVPRFKQQTLTDPELNKILKEEGMLVWGGDVRDVEPYSAGLKLNATTYPFVAFIALHPARHRTPNSGSSTTQNILSVLSRHAGAAETTPRALADHLREKLLPHMRPVFEKYRLEERTRQTDRLEREESERRARLAGERDVERIRRIREEDQRKAWEEKNERIRLMELRIGEAQKRMKTAARKAYWRQVGTALGEPSTTGPRITVRLPSGKRAVRQFEETEGIGAIYAFAASRLAESLPEEGEAADTLSYDVVQDGWGFLLATSYPRVPIPWSLDSGSGISSVAGGALRNGGMLVVEMDAEESGNGATSKPGASSPSADDEYLSEED